MKIYHIPGAVCPVTGLTKEYVTEVDAVVVGDCQYASSHDKATIPGAVECTVAPRPDHRLYTDIAESRFGAEIGWTATPRPLGDAMAIMVRNINAEVRERIRASGHDDYAIRQISDGTPIPDAVKDYAAAVRAAGNAAVVRIEGCDSVAAVAELPAPKWP
jgi:hypothetical protein